MPPVDIECLWLKKTKSGTEFSWFHLIGSGGYSCGADGFQQAGVLSQIWE